MTKKLLELAAKAYGIAIWFPRMAARDELGNRFVYEPCHTSINGETVEWNPFEDDAQAFKLMVKLKMSVDCDDYANIVMVYSEGSEYCVDETIENCDIAYAVRKAIVKCAAKVGEHIHD